MTIAGYGSFEQANITAAWGQRYKAGRVGSMQFDAPAYNKMGIDASDVNIPVKVHIRVNTTRYSSEWATDFIKRGRPFIFELIVQGGQSTTDIASALVAEFEAYEKRFNMSDRGLPFTYSASGPTVTLVLKDPYLSFQDQVDFLANRETYGTKATTTKVVPLFEDDGTTQVTVTGVNTGTSLTVSDTTNLQVGDTINILNDTLDYTIATIVDGTDVTISPALENDTAGAETVTILSQPAEPAYDGKYLEENVRMSTMYTSDSYGISADEKPYISGGYSSISFKAKVTPTSGLDNQWAPHKGGGSAADAKDGDREHTFTIYFLEGSDNFVNGGNVDEIVTFLTGGAPTLATFLKANGQAASDADDFIA